MQVYVQAGPDAGRSFSLERPVLVIGRQIGTDITINDSQVSRRHAQLDMRGSGNMTITDLGSANGTYVNGRRVGVQPEVVQAGVTVRIGNTTLSFNEPFATQPATLPIPAQTLSSYGPAFDPPAPSPAPSLGTKPFVAPQKQATPPPSYVPQAQPVVQSYTPSSPYVAPENVYVPPAPPSAQSTPPPVVVEKKPRNRTEILVGVIATIVLIAVLVFAITSLFPNLFGGTNAPAATTPSAVPAATVAQGQNGTNPPPPGPTTATASAGTVVASVPTAAPTGTAAPVATTAPVATATTAPTATAMPATTVPATANVPLPTAPAGSKIVQGFGANFAVPTDWLYKSTDDGQQASLAASPPTGNDAAVVLYRLTTTAATNDATTRLQEVIQSLQANPNTKTFKAQSIVTLPKGATVLIDMTTAKDVALRVYIYSTQNAQNVPYAVLMQARTERYSAFSAIFDTVITTLTFSGS